MTDLSKKDLELNGLQAGEFLAETGEDVLPRYIEISRQIALLEAEKKALKEFALEEALLYGKNGLIVSGAKVSVSNTGDRLDYSKDDVIAELKAQIKKREFEVKTANKSTGTYFDADGIQVDKVPFKAGSEILKISF